jgi:glycosyltransferase involved in cell wall biosynthesis
VFDFFIVGRGAGRDRELQSLIQNRQNIRVFEDVETVIPYLRGAILSIVPLLQGSGTRLKIIESMACETPVVSTSVGAEGLGATNGKEILIADTADSFADAIMRLLNDKALCQQIADNAYQFATANFGFESAERNVQYMTNEICGGTW